MELGRESGPLSASQTDFQQSSCFLVLLSCPLTEVPGAACFTHISGRNLAVFTSGLGLSFLRSTKASPSVLLLFHLMLCYFDHLFSNSACPCGFMPLKISFCCFSVVLGEIKSRCMCFIHYLSHKLPVFIISFLFLKISFIEAYFIYRKFFHFRCTVP